MLSYKQAFVYILIFFLFKTVRSDGDHAHEHVHDEGNAASSATSTAHSSPAGTVTTTHTSSGGDDFSSILSSLPPGLVNNLAANPTISQYLRSSGIDVGALTGAGAAAEAGAGPGPAQPGIPGGLGGFGGPGGFPGGFGFPFFGPFKQLHVSGDFGMYYPFVEKAIIIFGGGILILVIIALLTKGLSKGGLLWNFGNSFSEALAGSASVDLGPFHKSIAGAGAISGGIGQQPVRIMNQPQNLQLTQRVYDGIDQRF